jgi:hypothetical protein
MSTELTPYAQASLAERQDYARLIVTAGDMIPKALRDPNGTPNLGKVLLVMETGAMLGIHPVAALQGVNVIEGKASLSAGLMSALIRRAGHSLKVETSGTIEGGDLAATVTLTRKDTGDVLISVWTPKRAHQAGLCTYVEKDGVWSVRAQSQSGAAKPWQSYTAQLCKARAISEVYVEGATDLGMGAVYTPEELGSQDEWEDERPGPMGASVAIEGTAREASRDWVSEIAAADTVDALKAVWAEVRAEGALLDTIDGVTVRTLMEARAADLKESPGGPTITDEQQATIAEWASTLEWNERALMFHVNKVIGPQALSVASLSEKEAARLIVSLATFHEAETTPDVEPLL